ncbi:MAG: hypothetical protein KC978_22725, partial [Candidatus Omnitrophica bacterium]|nr:hypothetical protein [Candidatus Omnitrophota bacterium]
GYSFLRDLENRLVLLGKVGANGLPADPETLEWIVGCVNHAQEKQDKVPPWSAAKLVDHDRQTHQRIREIFDRLFEEVYSVE